MKRWENRTNVWLREKRDSITFLLLYELPLLALQLFCCLVLLLFLVLDPPLFCHLILDLSLICHLFLFILELLLLYCLTVCPLWFLDLQLLCCPFLCLVQLLLILHLQFLKYSNEPSQINFCAAVQLVLQSHFICFYFLACCPTKPIASALLI